MPRLSPCLALLALLMTSASQAEVASIELPAETIRLRESDLPGYRLATQKCSTCHSADYIEFQPPGMGQAKWTGLVQKMRDNYGADLQGPEIQAIGHYLSVAYDQPQASAASVAGASTEQLLAANGCLGCHAVDRKIVGPAFSQIAARYKADPLALQSVAEHIGEGGSGRWGELPMPPYRGMSQAEREQLAAYILGQ